MSTPQALIGRTLAGRFRVTGYIGDGAMATVYRGIQDAEPHDVAIKVLQPHLLSDRTFVGRFRRETKAAAMLQHRNTVRIVDHGIDGNLPYLVMELLAGQDLFERLVVERRLAPQTAAHIVAEICDALDEAHKIGIVHRDLKPENIMLVPDASAPGGERVKVLDFGIAKILAKTGEDEDGPPSSVSSVLTTAGLVVGTPAYMSPEQVRGEPIDARCDLYGCGVLLFHLVTGRLPFTGESPFEFAMKHVRDPPPRPTELVPELPVALERIILSALAKWPAERPQSAAALAAALRAFAGPAARGPRLPPSTDPFPQPERGVTPIAAPANRPSPDQGAPLPAAAAMAVPGTYAPAHGPLSGPAPSLPAPGSAPYPPASAVAARRGTPWLLVPLAMLLGVVVGVIAFYAAR